MGSWRAPLSCFALLFLGSAAQAKTYYVSASGSDGNDGLTPATAWQTTTQLNSSFDSLLPGDAVLFNRGDTFYGGISVTRSGSNGNPIVIGAYGTGAKPLLLGSRQENDPSDWADQGGNVWVNSDPAFVVDVGNIIFNDETSVGVKIMSASPTLNEQGEFWYDYGNNQVKMYSVGNPASVYANIQCALGYNAVRLSGVEYITFQDLDFRYWARCVWEYGGDNITWQDVDISFVGGADGGGNYYERFGNGLQIWEGAHDITIERCRIDNVYDAGISPQGYAGGYAVDSIFIRHNVVSNCEYGFEFYERDATASASNIYFEHNTIVNSGRGWAHNQRPDGVNGSSIRLVEFTASKASIFIRNNILYDSSERLFLLGSPSDLADMVLDYNDYYQPSGGDVGEVELGGVSYSTLATWKTAISQEADSIDRDPLFVSATDFHLQAESPAIGAGIEIGYGTDLGAYPYVAPANTPPIVSAGPDQSIRLPAAEATLTASASDPDGSIARYEWTKVSGGAASLSGSDSAALTVRGVDLGNYVFQILVTDNMGATASDTVALAVEAADGGEPAAPQGAEIVGGCGCAASGSVSGGACGLALLCALARVGRRRRRG